MSHRRRFLRWSTVGGVLITSMFMVGTLLLQTASASPIFTVDDAGADDEGGQKDLNFQTVDYGLPGATEIDVSWGWDDTLTSGGGQSLDACTLFDTDGDGFANWSLCESVPSSGPANASPYLFECEADNRTDRCADPTEITTFSSTIMASVVTNSDPFGVPSSPYFNPNHDDGNDCDANPVCNVSDMVAVADVDLSDFGDPDDVVFEHLQLPLT